MAPGVGQYAQRVQRSLRDHSYWSPAPQLPRDVRDTFAVKDFVADHWLAHVRHALGEVLDAQKGGHMSPEVESWCQRCLPTVVTNFLSNPWVKLLEGWHKCFVPAYTLGRDEHAKLHKQRATEAITSLQHHADEVAKDLVVVLLKCLKGENPWWAIKPLQDLLDETQPMYNKPAHDHSALGTEPTLIKRNKLHGRDIMDMVRIEFLSNKGLAEVAALLAIDPLAPEDLKKVFDTLKDLPWRWLTTSKQAEVAELVKQLEASVMVLTNARPGLDDQHLPKHVQLQAAVLQGLTELCDVEEEDGYVVGEEYELTRAAEVSTNPPMVTELPRGSVVEVKEVRPCYSETSWNPMKVKVRIHCGEITGWITPTSSVLHGNLLVRQRVPLEEVRNVANQARRGLCASCYAGRAGKQGGQLVEQGGSLLKEICRGLHLVPKGRDRQKHLKEFEEWLEASQILEALREELLGKDRGRAEKASRLLSESMHFTKGLADLLDELITEEAMQSYGGPLALPSLALREDAPPGVLAKVLKHLAGQLANTQDDKLLLVTQVNTSRSLLEVDRCWRSEPKAAAELLLGAVLATCGGGQSLAWAKTSLLQEWGRRFREGPARTVGLDHFREQFAVQLLARLRLAAEMHPAPMHPGDLVEVPGATASSNRQGVLRSPTSLRALDGDKQGIAMLEDGTLVRCEGLRVLGPRVVAAAPGSDVQKAQATIRRHAQEQSTEQVPLLLELLEGLLDGLPGSPRSRVLPRFVVGATKRSDFIRQLDRGLQASGAGLASILMTEIALFARRAAAQPEGPSTPTVGAFAPSDQDEVDGIKARLNFLAYLFRHTDCMELTALGVVQFCEWFLLPDNLQAEVKEEFLGWLRLLFASLPDPDNSTPGEQPAGAVLAPSQATLAARIVLDLMQTAMLSSFIPDRLGPRGYFLFVTLVLEVNGDVGWKVLELQDRDGRVCSARRICAGLGAAPEGRGGGLAEGSWVKVMDEKGRPRDGVLLERVNGAARWRIEYVGWSEDEVELGSTSGPDWRKLPDWSEQMPVLPHIHRLTAKSPEGLSGLWALALYSQRPPVKAHAEALLFAIHRAQQITPAAELVNFPYPVTAGIDVYFRGRWQRAAERDALALMDPRIMHLAGPGTTLIVGSSMVAPRGWRSLEGGEQERPAVAAPAAAAAEEAGGDGPTQGRDALLAGAMHLLSEGLTAIERAAEANKPALKQNMHPTLQILLSYIRATRLEKSVTRSVQASGRGWGEVRVVARIFSDHSNEAEPEMVLPMLSLPDHGTVQDIRRLVRSRIGHMDRLHYEALKMTITNPGAVKIVLKRTGGVISSENLSLLELGFNHGPGAAPEEIDVYAPKAKAPKGMMRSLFGPEKSHSNLAVVGEEAQPPAECLANNDAWMETLWRICGLAVPGDNTEDDELAVAACKVLWAIPAQKSLEDTLDTPTEADWGKLGAAPGERTGGLWNGLYVAALVDGRLTPPHLDADSDCAVEREALSWRRSFLESPGWAWLARLVLHEVPKPVPDASLGTGVPHALRALHFLLHGASLANQAKEEEEELQEEPGVGELQPEVMNRAFSAASVGLVLQSKRAGAVEIADRCSSMLEELLEGLQQPFPSRNKASEEEIAAASRLRQTRTAAAMAITGCLQAAKESRNDDQRVGLTVFDSLAALAQLPGIDVQPLRRKALSGLRAICLRDRDLRERVLGQLANLVQTSTETSEELAAVIAEVAFPGSSVLSSPSPTAALKGISEDFAEEKALSGLELLGAALGTNLLSAPQAKAKAALASLRVLAKCLDHPGGSALTTAMEASVRPDAQGAPAGGVAEQLLSRFVLLRKVPVASNLRCLAGDVVLKMLAAPECRHLLPGVAFRTLEWVAKTEAPRLEHRGWDGGLDWDYEPEVKNLVRESGKPVGLTNQGATCYMNSVLQQLFWAPSIRALLQRSGNSADAAGILRELKNTFTQLEKGSRAYHDPRDLVDACEALRLEYGVRRQNDAAEFFDKIMDYIQMKLVPPKAKEDGKADAPEPEGPPREATGEADAGTPAVSLAGLVKGSRVRKKRCMVCGAVTKVTEEPFFKLELPTRTMRSNGGFWELGSIEDCLEAMCAPELMCGDNKVECEKGCGYRRTDTEFETKLGLLPPVLCVQLKRFDFNLYTMKQEKLNHRVSFPVELDLRPFAASAMGLQSSKDLKPGGPGGQPELRRNHSNVISDELLQDPDRHRYQLRGVVVHTGMAGGGHFFSLVRTPGEHGKDQWYELNDSHVIAIQDTDIESRYFGGPGSYVSAYMLVYSRNSEVEASTISGLRGFQGQPAEGGRLLTLKVGTRVSIYSQRQGRWLHDGRVVESVPMIKGHEPEKAGGEELAGVDLEVGDPDCVHPPGAVRVQYDGGTREKWVLPEQFSSMLLMQGDSAAVEVDIAEEDDTHLAGNEAALRQHTAFSGTFLDFAKQLVESGLGKSPSSGDPASPRQEAPAELVEVTPLSGADWGPLAELAGVCLCQLVIHVGWARRFPEWEALCAHACSEPSGALAVLRAALRPSHADSQNPHLLRLLLQCPHREAPEVAARLMRRALGGLPEDSASRMALSAEADVDPIAKFIRMLEDRIRTELGMRSQGSLATSFGSPMNPMARWAEADKCVTFLQTLTDNRHVARRVATLPNSNFPGTLAMLVVQARRTSTTSMGGYFKDDAAAGSVGKLAASTLANVLSAMPKSQAAVLGCLSESSVHEIAKDEVYEALWETKSEVSRSLLRFCTEEQILRRIMFHIRFDHRRPGQHASSMKQFTMTPDDYTEQLSALDEVMLMPPVAGAAPSTAIGNRFQAMSEAVAEFHALFLLPNGVIRYQSHAGVCAVDMVRKCVDLGRRGPEEMALGEYITLDAAKEAIRDAFFQQLEAWEAMALWLAYRKTNCQVEGGAAAANIAFQELGKLMNKLGLKQVCDDAEKEVKKAGTTSRQRAQQAVLLQDSDDDVDGPSHGRSPQGAQGAVVNGDQGRQSAQPSTQRGVIVKFFNLSG